MEVENNEFVCDYGFFFEITRYNSDTHNARTLTPL